MKAKSFKCTSAQYVNFIVDIGIKRLLVMTYVVCNVKLLLPK